MLNKITFILGFLCLFGSLSTKLSAQQLMSATEPNTEAETFLDQTRRDRMNYTQQEAHRFDPAQKATLRSNNPNIIWIPIQMHIARDGYSAAASIFNSSFYISQANEKLIDANIQLYNCSTINFIDNPDVYNLSYPNISILNQYDVPNVLNFYFVNDLTQGANGPSYCGSSSYPGQGERVVYATRCFSFSTESVILHLLGQYFSLYPTHGTSSTLTELVTRGANANCSFAGDELCDTPADPNLLGSGRMSGCNYIWTGTDTNGDQYNPDTRNYMSYAAGSCRDQFSPMQLARMEYSAQFDRTYLACGLPANCSQTISQYPYAEGFENGLGAWDNAAFYTTFTTGVFTANSGPTPTANTGPSAASEGNQYAYADANLPNTGSVFTYPVATLESPCFDFSNLNNPELIFDYHMWGADVAQMSIQVSTDGGNHFDASGVVYNVTGDQGNNWETDTVDLSTFAGEPWVVFRFVAGFNPGEQGDIAIDKIWLGDANATNTCTSPIEISVDKVDYSCGQLFNGGIANYNLVQTGTAPYQVTWSNGATNTNTVNNLGTGLHYVKIEDAAGCTDSVAFMINELPPLSVSAFASNSNSTNDTDGSIDLQVSGGAAPYSYLWSTSATTEDLTGVGIGAYQYTVTDVGGCERTGSALIGAPLPCNGVKSNWPYSLSLDGGTGLFKQNTVDDNRNWKRRSGATPTGSTGPSAAAQGTHYRYIESSGTGSPNKRAILTTKKCLNLSSVSNPVLEFQYHMYGADMGSLEVQVSQDGGTTWSQSIWSQNGDQGNQWHLASINLSAWVGSNMRIRIIGTTGTGNKSDMAIDDLYLGGGLQSTNQSFRYQPELTDHANELTESRTWMVFPNPAVNALNIRFAKVLEQDIQVYLYNRIGQRMPLSRNQLPAGVIQEQLDISKLNSGIYFLQTIDSAGEVSIKRIVIQR